MADLFDHLEDAERAQGVADPAAVLTDDQLEEGGLRQVRAFVRTRASRNALRVQKHREKAAAEGLGQVNVVAQRPRGRAQGHSEAHGRVSPWRPSCAIWRAYSAPRRCRGRHLHRKLTHRQRLSARRSCQRLTPWWSLPRTRPGLRGWLIRRLAGV